MQNVFIFSSCPQDWISSVNGCFYFATDVESMTWYQAYDYCKSLDAYLAEILNNETQILLETYAADLPPTNWWIGATDEQSVSLHYLFLNMIPRYLLIKLI